MRIFYWNMSCLEPEIEAVSKEVFQLARHFRNSLIFGINTQYLCRFSIKGRYIGFSPMFDPILRALIPGLEFFADINHIYGEIYPWIFSKTLNRRPLVLTIASEKGCPRLDFLDRCRKIIVQTETLSKKLLALGLEENKLELLYPAVDLSRFRPRGRAPDPIGRPRVLFATAPRSQEEMDARGVNLLLMAAKTSPDIHYRLLYRRWKNGYTSLQSTENLIAGCRLENVTLTNNIIHDMPSIYNEHHFTVIPYTRSDGGKECPNSLVEGLSCGLPALITSVSPFAYFVEEHECGVVFDPTPSRLITAVELGMKRYRELSNNAIRTANTYFSQDKLLARVDRIYREIL
jgi:glycosyltransferase involved in cell wall biosynthesis